MSDSAPSTPTVANGLAALSARETEILEKAWSCLKTGPPEIDYAKLAAELNMGNPRSAANAWGSIKKKMAWSTLAPPSAAKSTGSKRKNTDVPTAAAADDTEDGGMDGSPAPKKKKTAAKPRAPRKKPTPKAAKGSDDGEEAAASEAQEQSFKPEIQVKDEAEVNEGHSGDDSV